MRSMRMLLAMAALLVTAGLPASSQAQTGSGLQHRPSSSSSVDVPAANSPDTDRQQESGNREESGQPQLSSNPQDSSAAEQGSYSSGSQPSTNASPGGTRFLVEIEEALSSKDDKAGKPFLARTLEPLATADGRVLPAGTRVHGHIDRVESAKQVGRARMWLTFDSIATPAGRAPLVAGLIDAPGVHSIRVMYEHEGEIEAASSKRQEAEQAAAAGALAGAATGMLSKNPRDAALGAAVGAATAFMITSGLGQEITLPKEMKLELVLERPLYSGRI
ncbi:MAG: hypothetical protein WA660_01380 [Candidatus Acidiferrales bacterium]